MTAPTQAQIEAAMSEYDRILVGIKRSGGTLTPENRSEAMAAALTAAAQVGEPKRLIPRSEVLSDKQLIAAVIERCAQVAETPYMADGKEIARAIRALKDVPSLDPNIIYPGKDLTNVFPEEE